MRIRTSGIVLAQDNEDTLGAVLQNLARVTDEIIVVDGGSRDGTCDIVQHCESARLFRRAFPGNFADQRNFAMDQARGDWVLHLDSDEILDEAAIGLIPYLRRIPLLQWFSFPRYWVVEQDGQLGYLADKPYYRDRQLRLFRNRPEHRFDTQGTPVHESLNRQGRGLALRRGHILHYDFLLKSRAQREAKAARYRAQAPKMESLHQVYLWEDSGSAIEPLPVPPATVLRPSVPANTHAL